MRLVHNQAAPVRPREIGLVGRRRQVDHFVRGHEHVELVDATVAAVLEPPLVFQDLLSRLFRAVVHDHVEVGPRLELALPVRERRQRRDDEEWPPQPLRRMEVVEERHRLHRFAEPHLVGEDRILFQVPVER